MSAAAQPVIVRVRPSLLIALATAGFTSIVAQIVLMRELFVISSGNEMSLGLSLAIWLFWTALGSSLLGRSLRSISTVRLFAALQSITALALIGAVVVARSSRAWWNAVPGEVLGPWPILLTALITLALFCPLSGCMFAVGARAYATASQRSIAEGAGSTYLLEAAGSTIGGAIASVIFVRFLDSLQIAAIMLSLNIITASWIGITGRTRRRAMLFVAVVVGTAMWPLTHGFERRNVSRSWPGFDVLSVRNSRYGSIAVVGTEGNRSVVQNGLVLFTVPDQASAEEAVHFPLLEHGSPHSVLLIGGGLNGSLGEVLKHPTVQRVDYVELDPALIKLATDYFPETLAKSTADPRVRIHHQDGRLFLKSVDERFDIIALNLPDPQTAQLNRYYTEEFFRDARAKLAPGGVLGFQLHAAEEFISPELAQFLASIDRTLRQVFPEVVTVPGDVVHFLASTGATPDHTVLTGDPQILLARLKERGVATTYLREYYLPFRMAPDRVADLRQRIDTDPGQQINRDFAPVAYYFNVTLWGAQFSSSYREAFVAASKIRWKGVVIALSGLMAFIVLLIAIFRRRTKLRQSASGFAVLVTGLTLMGTEVMLLLGFQAIYGYVFDELAAIIAGFMAGIALGSWAGLRQHRNQQNDLLRLLVTQVLMGLLPLCLVAALTASGGLRGLALSVVAHVAFPVAAITCGFAGGYQFPVAMRVFSTMNEPTSPGRLYGLDLFGAALGAVALSAYLLPVFGFGRAAELLAIANIAPTLLIALALVSFTAARVRS